MLNASTNPALRLANAAEACDATLAALLPFVDVATLPPALAASWAQGLALLEEEGAFSRMAYHSLLDVLIAHPEVTQQALRALLAELLRAELLVARLS